MDVRAKQGNISPTAIRQFMGKLQDDTASTKIVRIRYTNSPSLLAQKKSYHPLDVTTAPTPTPAPCDGGITILPLSDMPYPLDAQPDGRPAFFSDPEYYFPFPRYTAQYSTAVDGIVVFDYDTGITQEWIPFPDGSIYYAEGNSSAEITSDCYVQNYSPAPSSTPLPSPTPSPASVLIGDVSLDDRKFYDGTITIPGVVDSSLPFIKVKLSGATSAKNKSFDWRANTHFVFSAGQTT